MCDAGGDGARRRVTVGRRGVSYLGADTTGASRAAGGVSPFPASKNGRPAAASSAVSTPGKFLRSVPIARALSIDWWSGRHMSASPVVTRCNVRRISNVRTARRPRRRSTNLSGWNPCSRDHRPIYARGVLELACPPGVRWRRTPPPPGGRAATVGPSTLVEIPGVERGGHASQLTKWERARPRSTRRQTRRASNRPP